MIGKKRTPLKFVFYRYPELFYNSRPISRKELIQYLSPFYTITDKGELIERLKAFFEETTLQHHLNNSTKGTISKNTNTIYFSIPDDRIDYYEKEIRPILDLPYVKFLLAFYVFREKEKNKGGENEKNKVL